MNRNAELTTKVNELIQGREKQLHQLVAAQKRNFALSNQRAKLEKRDRQMAEENTRLRLQVETLLVKGQAAVENSQPSGCIVGVQRTPPPDDTAHERRRAESKILEWKVQERILVERIAAERNALMRAEIAAFQTVARHGIRDMEKLHAANRLVLDAERKLVEAREVLERFMRMEDRCGSA